MEPKTFVFFVMFCSLAAIGSSAMVNVKDLGAKADGKTDDAMAFIAAWNTSCSQSSPSTIQIPVGTYFLSPVQYQGPCKNTAITIELSGSLVAPAGGIGEFWIQLKNVNGVTLQGTGSLDGQGTSWWGSKDWKQGGAATLLFNNTENVVVRNIRSVNPKQFHMEIYQSKNVAVEGMQMTAPSNSPNTEGVHIEASTSVKVNNITVGTGDSCIAIAPGSQGVDIQTVQCAPGHGITIGVLGKASRLEDVNVEGVILNGTDNGLRINAVNGGNGYARNITFKDITMKNVKNPIVIDESFCASPPCPPSANQGGQLDVSGIKFVNIHGTSLSPTAINLNCNYPCRNITMQDVGLIRSVHTLDMGDNPLAPPSFCKFAEVSLIGTVVPKLSCSPLPL